MAECSEATLLPLAFIVSFIIYGLVVLQARSVCLIFSSVSFLLSLAGIFLSREHPGSQSEDVFVELVRNQEKQETGGT